MGWRYWRSTARRWRRWPACLGGPVGLAGEGPLWRLLAGGGAAAGAHRGSTGLFPVPDPRACRQGVGCGLRARNRRACRARRRARLLGVARRSARWRAPCPTRTAPSRPSLGGDLATTLRAGIAGGVTPRCTPPVESLGGARRVGGPPWCNPRWTTVAFGVNPKPRVTRRSAAPTGAAPARGRGRRPGCGWPRRACRGCGRRAF
jgi:hypothetical protein